MKLIKTIFIVIYSVFHPKPNLDTICEITERKIKLHFIKIFCQMIIFCNLLLHYFWPGEVLPCCNWLWQAKNVS